MRRFVLLGCALCFFYPTVARAELPLSRLDRVFPLGGAAGAEVTLDITGRDLDDVKTLHFDHPGFKAQLVKPNQFKVAIAADTPPGSYEVRAVGRFGISGARLFAVSTGLTEVLEKEPNDAPEQAQPVPLNCAVNGSSDGNGDDYFRFTCKKGERLTIDCWAIRLDSTLRPILSLAASDGKLLAQGKPYHLRTDTVLDFEAPADGDYILRLHDMTFSGGLPYRVVITNHPHIELAYPAAIVPGAKSELTLVGRNLPGGQKHAEMLLNDLPALTLPWSFQPPTDPLAQQRFTAAYHLPAPAANARGLRLFPDSVKLAQTPVTLVWADAPIVLDREPNDTAETAQPIALPAVVCGRFDRDGDADWYQFTAKSGETYAVDLLCERLDLPGDPFVILSDAKGNELATFDDHGVNFNAMGQFNRDAVGTFRVPADGTYRVFVQERYRKGGARYQYVLRLTKSRPDFYPVVCHETPNEPSCPTIWRGGSAYYDICLNRRDYAGPVTIEADGLPEGVSCTPIHISPQTQTGTVVFTATPTAPEWAGAVRLKAWAMIDGQRVEREVRCIQRRWAIANINTSVMVRQICLAVRAQAPYALRMPTAAVATTAGDSFEAKVKVERIWADFKGKVQLNGLNLPPGFSLTTVEAAPDQTEATLKLKVATNVPPGEYSLVVRGDAQVPYQRDPKMTARPNVRVADPSTALTVNVMAVKK